MNKQVINLNVVNEVEEKEKLMFSEDNIFDIVTLIRSKCGRTMLIRNEDNFKITFEDK